MTKPLMTPQEMENIQADQNSKKVEKLETSAQSTSRIILNEATACGFERVYLYNRTFENDSLHWPSEVVQRSVEILNESGMWHARAERVRFLHMLVFRNVNWRRQAGSPVWRIHIKPLK